MKFTNLKQSELIKGEYYYSKFLYDRSNLGQIIFLCGSNENIQDNNKFISIHKSIYGISSCCTSYHSLTGEQLRIATNDERRWLNECIKANKFIPFNELKIEQHYEIY